MLGRDRGKLCVNCGKGFRASRRDARFCSDRCRQAARRRGRSVTSPPVSVTSSPRSVTAETERKTRQPANLAAARRFLRAMGVDDDD